MEIIRKVKVRVFRTCPLLPLVHNEMSGTVTLMRCVKDAHCRRRWAACLAAGSSGQVGGTADPASSLCLQNPISNILSTHLPATWAVVLLTFSSAFCTLVGCDDNCHGTDAMFITPPVANPDGKCRILPASPQGSPLRNCKANKNHGGWNCNPLVPLCDGMNLVLHFNGARARTLKPAELKVLYLLNPELKWAARWACSSLCVRFLCTWDRNLSFLICSQCTAARWKLPSAMWHEIWATVSLLASLF